MAGQSSAMIGSSWTDTSVLGSQVFGQALMDSCEIQWFFFDAFPKGMHENYILTRYNSNKVNCRPL